MKRTIAGTASAAIRQLTLLTALVAFTLASCKPAGPNYGELGLVKVSGRVTMDNKPLAGVTVRFEGPPNRFADGKTDSSGNYRLMYDSNQAGCLPGEKIVRITSGGAGEGSDEEAPVEGADGKVAQAAQSIPAAYNKSSTLTANVAPGNDSFNFDLKSMP